ncbi:cbb3-type cytochrome oxidase assembly protein CcoS [Herbaspirillum autotrophicum]|uniref:cbb3-type cytochrome oxidase assembly protein CcoS n=1 Tax=Herbaspirillum autotrophicum TaxID=180195 RepID=UPI00067C04C3|nr:cbb3-type cytochrome oxidase assembly protein CcoS [Herbaspirillum autotrophicum]
MEALYLLIPLSTLAVFFALWIFFRASDSGQFDDMVGPAMRILHDDDNVVAAAPETPVDGSVDQAARVPHEQQLS